MSGIFHWFTGSLSKASNSAAETLLVSILKRFIQEPYQDDMLSLQLFDNWAIDLTLRRVFIDVSLMNKCVPFLSFSSIYISQFKIKTAYNLSEIDANLERTIIEFYLNKQKEEINPDSDLTQSVKNLQQELPEETKGGIGNWLLNCLKNVHISLKKVTIILHPHNPNSEEESHLDPLYLDIDMANGDYKHCKEFELNLNIPQIKVSLGTKKRQRPILLINKLNVVLSRSKMRISLDSIDVKLEEQVPLVISAFINSLPGPKPIPQAITPEVQAPSSEPISTIENKPTLNTEIPFFEIYINISMFLFNSTPQLCFNIGGINGTILKDSISFSTSSFLATDRQKPFITINEPLSFSYKQSKEKHQNPLENTSSIKTFDEGINYLIQRESRLNSQSDQIELILPTISIITSFDLINDTIQIYHWFIPLLESPIFISSKSTPPISQSENDPNDFMMKFKLPKFSFSYETIKFELIDASITFLNSKAGIMQNLDIFLSLENISLETNPDFKILESSATNQKPIIKSFFLYSNSFDKNPFINASIFLSNVFLRYPSYSDITFISQSISALNSIISKEFSPSSQQQTSVQTTGNETHNLSDQTIENKPESHNNINIRTSINIENVNFDYILLGMPARYILSIPRFSANFNMSTYPFSLNLTSIFGIECFISNERLDLPLLAFSTHPFPFTQFNFVKFITLNSTKTSISIDDKSTISVNLEKLEVSGGLCFDSLKIILSTLNHILYGFEKPESERPPLHNFSLPDELSFLEKSILPNQSQPIPFSSTLPQSNVIQFDNMDSLRASAIHPSLQIEPIESNDDLPEDEVTPYEPINPPKINLVITASVRISLYGGRDFGNLYPLKPMKKMPVMFKHQNNLGHGSLDSFDILGNREEWRNLTLEAGGTIGLRIYENDPVIGIRVSLDFPTLGLKDEIPTSEAAYLFSINPEKPAPFKGTIDILATTKNRTELSLFLEPPPLILYITQPQVDFLMDFGCISMPTFPADNIIDEAAAFQVFSIKNFEMQTFAHFRMYMDVHLDGVNLKIPSCTVYACKGGDELAGELGEFYTNELLKPGVLSVLRELPVIRGIRQIGGAIKNVFTFDAKRYGFGKGLAVALGSLLRVVGSETVNVGVAAVDAGDRAAKALLEAVGAEDLGNQVGMATLIVKNGGRNLPEIILAPGVLVMPKIKEILKNMRDAINPQFRKAKDFQKL